MPATRRTRTANVKPSEDGNKGKRKQLESQEKKPVLKKVKVEKLPLKEQQNVDNIKGEPLSRQLNIKEEARSGSESDSDASDISDIMSRQADFIKQREENIRMNQEFFKKLGIAEAKEEFGASVQKKKPSERGLKREKKPKEILPRRSSLRLQNKTPEGGDLPPEALIRKAFYTSLYEAETHDRPPAGPLNMAEYLHKTSTPEEHEEVMRMLGKLACKPAKPATEDLEKYAARLQGLSIREEQVAKVVPERTFSVTLHPTSDRVLAATGDKWGKIGLWDVVPDGKSDSDGVCCYAPHSRPITWLEFPDHQTDRLYSCGYDGSLRCADLKQEVFNEVYSVPEEEDILLRNFSFTSPHTMLVSQNSGCVALVDTRTEGTKAEHTYQLHHRSLRTVSVHPMEPHYFCTGGVDGLLRVWDLRKVKVKGSQHIAEMPHNRSINSAFFSPVTGNQILSTCMDDTLRIFDTSVVGSGIEQKKSIRHKNHTGRWLTLFRASWHPRRDDLFVVGSMSRPREIELFNNDGKKLHSLRHEEYLASICSLNAIHPTRDIVVGANSSGRLFVFM